MGESLNEVNIKYLDGLKMLIEFNSEQEARAVLEHKKEWLDKWFNWVKPWSNESMNKNRIVWLTIVGVPIQVWYSEVFSRIAKVWGEVIIPEECSTDRNHLNYGRVCILTNLEEVIISSLKIKVDGVCVNLRIFEDLSNNPANQFWNPLSKFMSNVQVGVSNQVGDILVESSCNIPKFKTNKLRTKVIIYPKLRD